MGEKKKNNNSSRFWHGHQLVQMGWVSVGEREKTNGTESKTTGVQPVSLITSKTLNLPQTKKHNPAAPTQSFNITPLRQPEWTAETTEV